MNTRAPALATKTAHLQNKPKICHVLILTNQGVPSSPLEGSLSFKTIVFAGALTRRGPTRAFVPWPGSGGTKPPPQRSLREIGRISTAALLLRDCNGIAGLRKPGASPTRCMLWILNADLQATANTEHIFLQDSAI